MRFQFIGGFGHNIDTVGREVREIEVDGVRFVPKRTCEDTYEVPRLFTCSACGETEYAGTYPNYCPWCGAKVVK